MKGDYRMNERTPATYPDKSRHAGRQSARQPRRQRASGASRARGDGPVPPAFAADGCGNRRRAQSFPRRLRRRRPGGKGPHAGRRALLPIAASAENGRRIPQAGRAVATTPPIGLPHSPRLPPPRQQAGSEAGKNLAPELFSELPPPSAGPLSGLPTAPKTFDAAVSLKITGRYCVGPDGWRKISESNEQTERKRKYVSFSPLAPKR